MTALVVVLICISYSAIVTLFVIAVINEEDDYTLLGVLFKAGLFGVAAICGGLAGRNAADNAYNNGQIDALKGKQTFEIQYVFPQGDTIPVDTLYVKITQ